MRRRGTHQRCLDAERRRRRATSCRCSRALAAALPSNRTYLDTLRAAEADRGASILMRAFGMVPAQVRERYPAQCAALGNVEVPTLSQNSAGTKMMEFLGGGAALMAEWQSGDTYCTRDAALRYELGLCLQHRAERTARGKTPAGRAAGMSSAERDAGSWTREHPGGFRNFRTVAELKRAREPAAAPAAAKPKRAKRADRAFRVIDLPEAELAEIVAKNERGEYEAEYLAEMGLEGADAASRDPAAM